MLGPKIAQKIATENLHICKERTKLYTLPIFLSGSWEGRERKKDTKDGTFFGGSWKRRMGLFYASLTSLQKVQSTEIQVTDLENGKVSL